MPGNSYRNPELLADVARTADRISDGRLIRSIGAGCNEKDYTECGYEFGPPGRRIDDLAAALPRIEARLARLNPPPTPEIPLLIGGGGEQKAGQESVVAISDGWPRPRKKMPGKPEV